MTLHCHIDVDQLLRTGRWAEFTCGKSVYREAKVTLHSVAWNPVIVQVGQMGDHWGSL
jgi:hypothetical protein